MNPFFRGNIRMGGASSLFLFFLTGILTSCANLQPVPQVPPLDPSRIDRVRNTIRVQQEGVSAFFSSGTLRLREGLLKMESDVVVVGTRDPFRILIELTHPWGKPLLHVLIEEDRLEVLSFDEERHYVGPFDPAALSRFIPGPMPARILWSALRGYPDLLEADRILPSGENQVSLLDGGRRVIQTLDLVGEDLTPRRFQLPAQGIRVTFLDYRWSGDIRYAGQVRVEHRPKSRVAALTVKRAVFNRPVPEEIFRLHRPPHFIRTPFKGMP